MRRRQAGFTLVEVVLASMLTAIVVGSLASIYAFTARESADAIANLEATRQARLLAVEMRNVISNSVSCAIVTSGGNTGLQCTMPVNGTDRDGDGYYDDYSPRTISKRGLEKYGTGKRIWFYRAGITGNFTTVGSYIWRAQRNDGLTPTSTDKDANFGTYYGGANKWPLIESISFSVDQNSKTTTFTIVCSKLNRADRIAATADVNAGTGYRTTITETVFWENWRR